MDKIIKIALDGPSGSGKSTVAKRLSHDLDILYLDTGAMYRACALKCLSLGIDTFDEKGVSTFINDINIEIICTATIFSCINIGIGQFNVASITGAGAGAGNGSTNVTKAKAAG